MVDPLSYFPGLVCRLTCYAHLSLQSRRSCRFHDQGGIPVCTQKPQIQNDNLSDDRGNSELLPKIPLFWGHG